MLEVHVVTSANRHLYERELDEHHQIRYRIYVEELRWRGLTARSDKREYDQFDMPETVYLLGLEEGNVVGGLRLVPTTGPTLLNDVFSRFAVRERRSAAAPLRRRNGPAFSWCPSGARNTAPPKPAARSPPP